MRSCVHDYELVVPKSLDEALAKLAAEPGEWHPLAGGTDVMVLYEAGQLRHRRLLNLWQLKELRGISESASHVALGALSTYTDVQRNAIMQREFPNLVRAGAETGGLAIQNRGTLGGNIANASPAADTPPALLAYGAEIELVSTKGSRWVPYDGFHTAYKKTVMAPGELIKTIRLVRSGGWTHHYYRKVGTRKAQAISKVVASAAAKLDGGRIVELRAAMGSVAPITVRLAKVEACVKGERVTPALIAKAREAVAQDVAPIDDIRSTQGYRLDVARNLVQDLLESLR